MCHKYGFLLFRLFQYKKARVHLIPIQKRSSPVLSQRISMFCPSVPYIFSFLLLSHFIIKLYFLPTRLFYVHHNFLRWMPMMFDDDDYDDDVNDDDDSNNNSEIFLKDFLSIFSCCSTFWTYISMSSSYYYSFFWVWKKKISEEKERTMLAPTDRRIVKSSHILLTWQSIRIGLHYIFIQSYIFYVLIGAFFLLSFFYACLGFFSFFSNMYS